MHAVRPAAACPGPTLERPADGTCSGERSLRIKTAHSSARFLPRFSENASGIFAVYEAAESLREAAASVPTRAGACRGWGGLLPGGAWRSCPQADLEPPAGDGEGCCRAERADTGGNQKAGHGGLLFSCGSSSVKAVPRYLFLVRKAGDGPVV